MYESEETRERERREEKRREEKRREEKRREEKRREEKRREEKRTFFSKKKVKLSNSLSSRLTLEKEIGRVTERRSCRKISISFDSLFLL